MTSRIDPAASAWAARPVDAHGNTRTPAAGASPFRFDIQGLRAVAVLMVVVFHVGLPFPGGFVGVDVFFVISGFVITAMLAREQERTGTIRFGAFYVRRFKRLTPALAVTVAVTVVASALLLPPLGAQQNVALTALGAMLLSANFVIAQTTGGYFDIGAELNPLLHTWSLSVEEQFYLFFPLLLLVGWVVARRLPRLRAAPVLGVGLIAALSFAIAVLDSTGQPIGFLPSWLVGFYGPLGRAWEFAVGALLALVVVRLGRPHVALASALGMLGLGLLGASLFVISEATPFPGLWTLLPVTGTLLLILAGSSAANPISRVLATRPMVAIGDLSYSWYLWHWPMIVFADLLWPDVAYARAAAGMLSLIPAVASYRWVEQPLRSLPSVRGRRLARIVTATVLPPIVLATGLLVAADNGFWSNTLRDYQAAIITRHAGGSAGCTTPVPIGDRQGKCVWNADAKGAPIYLVGDSNADQFSEAVIGAGERLGAPVVIATLGSCPFADVFVDDVTHPTWWDAAACREWYERTLEWLAAQPHATVVISQSLEYWISARFAAGAGPDELSTDAAAKLSLFRTAFERTLETLTRAGREVVVVQSIPKLVSPYAWDPQRCTTLSIFTRQCDITMPREWDDGRQGPAMEAQADAAADAGARVLDLRDELCPAGSCSTRVDGRAMYRDAYHLSVRASQAFVPDFADAMHPAP